MKAAGMIQQHLSQNEGEYPRYKLASQSVIIWHKDCLNSFSGNPKMKPSIKGISIFLFFFYFGALSLSPALTQKQEKTQELRHEVTVTLKLIQVYVTDKQGNPILDLKKEDFIIYDNGEEKPITEFEQHILFLPSIEEKVQPEIIQKSKLPAPRELMNRKFYLLFDFAFNNAQGVLKAKEAALHFIDTQLQPSDEVAVLSFSGSKSLVLHEDLTSHHAKIRQVVESFGLKDILGKAGDFKEKYSDLSFKDASQGEALPGGGGGVGAFVAKIYTFQMTDLAKALRYVPGNKHMILFSSGLPAPAHTKLYDFIRDMLKELSASDTVVYTLNTEDPASVIGEPSRNLGDAWLQNIATSTGGKYFGNIYNYESHMEEIQNLTGCYYVLGYYIGEKWDGKYNRIKVEVKRPSCKVYAQDGYFNPKPFSEYSKLEKMLHLVDLALTEEHVFQTPVCFPMVVLPCMIKGKTNLALYSKIDRESIQELSGEKIEIVSLIFDNRDNIIKIERDKKDFSRLPIGNIYHSSLLPADPGEYKCRVVIRNLETGRGAVASSSIKIPEFQDYGLQLDTPLLLKRERNAFYLQEPSPVYPFDSSLYSPLVGELERGTKRIFAVLRCTISGIQQPDIHLSAKLIHLLADTEKNIPAALSILNKHQEEGTVIFLIELQTEELQSGEYFLYLSAEDKLTQSRSDVDTTFKVK